jgi:hypothetical protein
LNEKQKKDPGISDGDIKSTSEEQHGNPFGRKIRIHTDWSDTGPNSMPQNEMTANGRLLF